MSRLSNFLVRKLHQKKLELNLDRPIISFTFDDIAESAVTFAPKAMEKYNIMGTFYVAAELLGKEGAVGKYASDYDVKALSETGHHIAHHTFSHVSVATLSDEDLKSEVEKNNNALYLLTGLKTLKHFSYPFGKISLPAKKFMTQHFLTMRSVFPGVNFGTIDLAALRAVSIYDRCVDKKRISDWISKVVSTKGWLIFYTHDISDNPSYWGTSKQLFKFVLDEAVSSNASVLNIEQASAHIR